MHSTRNRQHSPRGRGSFTFDFSKRQPANHEFAGWVRAASKFKVLGPVPGRSHIRAAGREVVIARQSS
jgi:hypothetical protein